MTLRPTQRSALLTGFLLILIAAISLFTMLLWSGNEWTSRHLSNIISDSLLAGAGDDQLALGDPTSANKADTDEVATYLAAVPSVQVEHGASQDDHYKLYSEGKLRQLAVCMARGDCPKNADKIVIIATYHCEVALYHGYNGGEGVWCMAMIHGLEQLGFTVLHAGDADYKYILHLHRQVGDLIKVIIAGKEHNRHGEWSDILKTPERPHGVPAWKMFQFEYFPSNKGTLVGDEWVVCAEPPMRDSSDPSFNNYTYVGYSLEPPAEEMNVIPFNERPYRVYILSKRVQYFYESVSPATMSREEITRAAKELADEFPGFEFVGAFVDDRNDEAREKSGHMEIPEGVRNMYPLDAAAWDAEVAKSRLLMGIGYPTLSPSPYRALAMGVPFLNPEKFNEHGSRIFSQHSVLEHEVEPYAYNTEAHNYTRFLDVVRAAMTTEISPHRYDRMHRSAFHQRLYDLVTADWRGYASYVLEHRVNGTEVEKGDPDNFKVFELKRSFEG